MAIENMAEFFGCDGSEIFEEKEQAEGYLLGCRNASLVHAVILKEYPNRSKAFREGLLNALREQL